MKLVADYVVNRNIISKYLEISSLGSTYSHRQGDSVG